MIIFRFDVVGTPGAMDQVIRPQNNWSSDTRGTGAAGSTRSYICLYMHVPLCSAMPKHCMTLQFCRLSFLEKIYRSVRDYIFLYASCDNRDITHCTPPTTEGK